MELLSIREIVIAVKGTLLSGDENTQIASVSTNSKEIGEMGLFVPIIGEKVDGHQYIGNAFDHGAIAVFTSNELNSLLEGKAYIKVTNTLEALQRLATYYREQFSIPVIGITGSVGKTTTKEMIATALESKYKVLKTAGNMNSQVGVPLMMFQISKTDEIAVIEMGMSEVGEMSRLAVIAKPNMAVMTNIGVSHIAQLKTRENIRKEKLNIINEFHENGILFVNGNDKLLYDIYDEVQNHLKYRKNTVSNTENPQLDVTIDISENSMNKLKNTLVAAYGTTKNCEYHASDIKTIGNATHFTFHSIDATEEIELGVLGEHNVYNAVVALAIATHFEVPLKDAKASLKAYRPIAMRGQIEEVNGIKIIDDTYNASPDSMKSGVSMLLELPASKRRIAVLADVLELGEHSYDCHYGVGEFIAGKSLDLVVTIGSESKAIVHAINQKDKDMKTASFDENGSAIAYLKEFLKKGDAILIKGSRGMHTEEIVNGIKA